MKVIKSSCINSHIRQKVCCNRYYSTKRPKCQHSIYETSLNLIFKCLETSLAITEPNFLKIATTIVKYSAAIILVIFILISFLFLIFTSQYKNKWVINFGHHIVKIWQELKSIMIINWWLFTEQLKATFLTYHNAKNNRARSLIGFQSQLETAILTYNLAYCLERFN